LAKKVAETQLKWQLLDALILNSLGTIEPIVLVAVRTANRGDAIDARR
jgi:molybdopterin synthase catalytic subunit